MMADTGDDLLEGELDETAFGELDGEEEDALLADDDYDSYQNSRQTVFAKKDGTGHSELFHIVDQVQDVSEGDEIIEDGEEDILELAVVDELDESELDNGQSNNQMWNETPLATGDTNRSRGVGVSMVGVSSSTVSFDALGADSDEEESDGRGSRFKTERTNIISLKGVGGKSLSDIPDSLDKVQTPLPTNHRPRGGMQRGKGSVRGRLGPMPRGGSMRGARGGFGSPRRPMPPPQQQHPLSHKIHINPHFRGGMHQQDLDWDERLPPPPGCEGGFPSPSASQEGGWGGPPPSHHMGKPPFPQHQPGPPPQFQHPPQMYPHPPQQNQGYDGQFQPMSEAPPPPNTPPNRVVQFSDNTQLITVANNRPFQRPGFDQNFAQRNNQFQPPQNMPPPHFNNNNNNNNAFPNQFNSPPRPPFQPQSFPSSPNYTHSSPQHPPQDFYPPQNPPPFPLQNYDSSPNNWNSAPQPMDQQGQYYHQGPPGQPGQPVQPPQHLQPPQHQQPQQHMQPPQHQQPQQHMQPQQPFCGPEQSSPAPQFQPPFQNQPTFRTTQPGPRPRFQGNVRGRLGMKRQQQRPNKPAIPVKQMRFEVKQKSPSINVRANLQEIKTVDNLPDTTTTQEPEPEIEEDEETRQYRLKIAEQKALREKILKEKEARRLASIIEKQKQQEINSAKNVSASIAKPQTVVGPPQVKPQPQFAKRGRGVSVNRLIPKQQTKPPLQLVNPQATATPVVQIQQMLGTMYKIVKVRTKEGAIVTRKTPMVMEGANTSSGPLRTISTNPTPMGQQRRIVLTGSQQNSLRVVQGRGGAGGAGRGGLMRGAPNNAVRMVQAKQVQGRTLFTVQTSSAANIARAQAPQRLVRLPNPATPALPVSTVVTIDNLSLSTRQDQIRKMAKEVGNLCSFKHEPDLRRATLKFQNPKEAEQFYLKFHRKMIDLSRILVTVVPQ